MAEREMPTVEQMDHDAADKFVRDWCGAESIPGALAMLLAQTRLAATKAADERVRVLEDALRPFVDGASQQGGQVVGPGPQGVRGVHFIDGYPTGIQACCGIHRSQHKNKRAVEEMIEWALASI